MGDSKGRVLITGVTGYLGSWCTHLALEAGYQVIGTVRQPDSPKCQFLRDAMAGAPTSKNAAFTMSRRAEANLTLVQADLLAGDAEWDELVGREQPTHVMHTASPYSSEVPEDENDMIRPAVEGTESVVRACAKHGVKRVVLTSSMVAVWSTIAPGKRVTDKDWTDPDVSLPYPKSKTLAEKAAWAAVEGTDTQMVTILPGAIYGPTLYNKDSKGLSKSFESGAFIHKMFTGGVPFLPKNMKLCIVDVRDVAMAHVKALNNEEVVGRRVLTSGHVTHFINAVYAFQKAVPGLSFSTKLMPNWVVRLYGKLTCSSEYKQIAFLLGIEWSADTTLYSDQLGLEWTSIEKMAQDMTDDFVEIGALTPKEKS